MILEARSVGELAFAMASRSGEGAVSRVFRNSAYVKRKDDFILILLGDLRSPMTVNVEGDLRMDQLLAVGEGCRFVGGEVRSGGTTIQTKGAKMYESRLRRASPFNPVSGQSVVRGAAMVKLLYSVAPSPLDLIGHKAFGEFIGSVVRPLASGDSDGLHKVANYIPLVGLGGGFTPAGDDLIAGFSATYNHVAASTGGRPIRLARKALAARTVPESAAILDYAQNGYVDEAMEALILAATEAEEEQFTRQLLAVASRGHTSGMDMTVGVLLCLAALGENGEHGILERALGALTGSRTL